MPDDITQKNSSVPWKEMAGMREIQIHQYTEVDEDIVWKTITQKIPPLKQQIAFMINEISK